MPARPESLTQRTPRALIAEDEPVLADALQRHLRQLWPGLQVAALAGDGHSLIDLALQHLPDVLFVDIHMPGLNGLDATERLSERWPLDHPLPLLCFVTAYDQHAVTAFERAAVDYVLKPVRADRLALTCTRLQQQLALRPVSLVAGSAAGSAEGLATDGLADPSNATAISDPLWTRQWPALVQAKAGAAAEPMAEPCAADNALPLQLLQASSGASLYFIDVQDVLYLEAADKYVRIVVRQPPSGAGELLMRTSLRELLPRLPADRFWQIHRSVVVNAHAIERVSRHQQRLRVHLRQHPDMLDVSRMHAHLFKAL